MLLQATVWFNLYHRITHYERITFQAKKKKKKICKGCREERKVEAAEKKQLLPVTSDK